jgi:hypothetical protein
MRRQSVYSVTCACVQDTKSHAAVALLLQSQSSDRGDAAASFCAVAAAASVLVSYDGCYGRRKRFHGGVVSRAFLRSITLVHTRKRLPQRT